MKSPNSNTTRQRLLIALLFSLWGCGGLCLYAQDSLVFPPGAGTMTWTCGERTWSDAVRYAAPGCAAADTLAEADSIPAQYAVYMGSRGYYYNLACVRENLATLCPPPWRLPKKSDFYSVERCFGLDYIAGTWGEDGIRMGGSLYYECTRGALWVTNRDRTTYHYVIWRSDDMGFVDAWAGAGVQVRCVK